MVEKTTEILLISNNQLIILFNLLFFISFLNLFYAKHFLQILISFELMFLNTILLYCLSSFLHNNAEGMIVAYFIIGVVACETCLGLSLYIKYYRLTNK